MYDVVYLDDGQRSRVIATGVTGDVAAEVARSEAKARRAARMFESGSEPPRQGPLVLIVASARAGHRREGVRLTPSPSRHSGY